MPVATHKAEAQESLEPKRKGGTVSQDRATTLQPGWPNETLSQKIKKEHMNRSHTKTSQM